LFQVAGLLVDVGLLGELSQCRGLKIFFGPDEAAGVILEG
jgi:hypothetical protein